MITHKSLDFSNFDSFNLIESPQDGIKVYYLRNKVKKIEKGGSRSF